jgi:hypothetical protein
MKPTGLCSMLHVKTAAFQRRARSTSKSSKKAVIQSIGHAANRGWVRAHSANI